MFVKHGCPGGNKLWQNFLSPTFWPCPKTRGMWCQWSVRNPKMNLQSKFGYCIITQTLSWFNTLDVIFSEGPYGARLYFGIPVSVRWLYILILPQGTKFVDKEYGTFYYPSKFIDMLINRCWQCYACVFCNLIILSSIVMLDFTW